MLIAAFVVLQFLVPLTYLGRQDATDERFTWRSLSEADAPACTSSATLERASGEREPISIEALIHPDWLGHVAEGRQAVIDAFMKTQCESDDVLSVELVNRCDDDPGLREYTLRCGGERAHRTVRTAAR